MFYILRTVTRRLLVHRYKIMISPVVFLYFFLLFFLTFVNIKILIFFIGSLQQFFNKKLFFKFINKCQTEILLCAPRTSHVCDFFFLYVNLKFDLMFFIQLYNEIEQVRFLKDLIKPNCFNFCCLHYQIYLIQQIWSN